MLSIYPACFYKEENRYSVIFPDLNYIAIWGNTLEEAFSRAVDCLATHLYWLSHDGKETPAASDLASINAYQIAEKFGFTPQEAFVNIVTVDVAEYAKNDEYLVYASKNLHNYNFDWLIRERCRAREDFENHERNMQLLLDEKDQIIAEKDQAIAEKERAIAEKERAIAEKERAIAEKERAIAEKDLAITEKTARIKELAALQNY